MSINRIKLINCVNIIDHEIDELKQELSFLEAAKKNLQTLIDKLTAPPLPSSQKEEKASTTQP